MFYSNVKIRNIGLLAKSVSLVFILLTLATPAMAMKAPEEVVKDTVNTIVNNIQANRDAYSKDNQKLYSMVDSVLVPTIHIDRMAKLILGRENSKLATDAQKKQFADEFKTFLMRSYATALLEYTGSEKVIYEPVERAAKDDIVTIKAKLVAADGQSYPISLYMSNRKDTQWRAYNIEVANINFVGTYRATFGDIISRKGIEGLIEELRNKNAKNAPLSSTS